MFTQLQDMFSTYGSQLHNHLFVKSPLSIHDFVEKRVIRDDIFNKVKNGEVYRYYYHNDLEIGGINYRIHNGQIGIIDLLPEYRGRGLGKQILSEVIVELKGCGVSHVWAVASEENPFWKNVKVFNKSFTFKKRVHNSVSGSGYIMEII